MGKERIIFVLCEDDDNTVKKKKKKHLPTVKQALNHVSVCGHGAFL